MKRIECTAESKMAALYSPLDFHNSHRMNMSLLQNISFMLVSVERISHKIVVTPYF